MSVYRSVGLLLVSKCLIDKSSCNVQTIRRQQELESSHSADNPVLMSELRALRMRKDELETHLITLQDSRRQLMIQLEGLMKMLKVLGIKMLKTLS